MTSPSESSDPQNAVALNDTVDLMRLLTDGTLFRLLNQPRALAASCQTVRPPPRSIRRLNLRRRHSGTPK